MAQNPNLAHLDQGQIINRVFDPAEDRLRVDAEVTAVIPGPVEVAINNADDSIALGTATELFTATTVGSDVGLDVNVIGGSVTGELIPSGLTTAGLITTMDVTDVATPIPATPLNKRNSLAVSNLSSTDTLYVGFSNAVTADRALGTNSGWEIGPNEGFNLDITNSIIVYGIAPTGKTIRLKVMELA